MNKERTVLDVERLQGDGAIVSNSDTDLRGGDGATVDVPREGLAAELHARARQQAAVAELGQHALAGALPDTLMHRVVEVVAAVLDVEYCKVLELLPDGENLFLRAGVGWHDGIAGVATVGAREQSQAGYTLLSAEPVVVADLGTETRFSGPALLLDHQVVSGVSVVIAGPDRPFGILGAHTTHRRDFTLDDVHFLQSVANVLGTAIERHSIEDALRANEERLQLAMEAGRLGTWEWSVATGEVNWSRSLEAVHGLEPGTFGGTFDAYFADVHPADREQVRQTISRTIEQRSDYAIEYRIIWPNGDVRWIYARGLLFVDEQGRPSRLRGVCVDVTERKRAEEALRFLAESSELLVSSLDYETTLASVARLLVPQIADWCAVDVLKDNELRRVAVTHVDPEKVNLARELGRRYPPNLEARYGVPHVLRTGEPEVYSDIPDSLLVQVARDAEHLALLRALGMKSAVVVPLIVRRRSIGAITIVSAESGRRYGQEDLRLVLALAGRAAQAVDNSRLFTEAQTALRARDDLLHTVSHDLRQPLTVISGYAQMLQRALAQEDADDRKREGVDAIVANAQRLGSLIADLVDSARIEAGQFVLDRELLQLGPFLRAVINRTTAIDDGGRLHLELPEKSLAASADPSRLERAIVNLIGNAIKYSPDGAPVIVSLRAIGSEAVVSVVDQGPGVTPEQQRHLFERFYRAEESVEVEGLGLGLYITRLIIESHGGRVWVESEPGSGSTFSFSLPLTE
jgi:PAS domain S-box-containing protein